MPSASTRADRALTHGWRITHGGDLPRPHIHPIGDLRDHDVRPDGVCWCEPPPGPDVVHRSLDGREEFEEGRRLVS